MGETAGWRDALAGGVVIPACPLPLDAEGRWAQRHQRAIIRYYLDSGAGGLAVGVHSTQFAIRAPEHAIFEPLLRMASGVIDEALADRPRPFVKIAGVCGETPQAISEARLAVDTGYHAGLLSLSAVARRTEPQLLEHCAAVAAEIPLVGFYLQPAVGGRVLSYRFWRSLAELESLVAIKIAPFNRYQTLDVVRAVIDAGRSDVALYTGNDDNIVVDLLTPFEFSGTTRWIVGGLLGQWGVWTRRAVELLDEIKTARGSDDAALAGWLSLNAEVTDANAAIFDAANRFAGCIPGIMEVLRRQGLTPSNRCLDPAETLSPGQSEGIDRVWLEHRHLTDDAFVQANLDRWLSP